MKIQLKYFTILILTAGIAFAGCDGGASGLSTYEIGETGPSGVGIVFYIAESGTLGFEAAPALWNGGTEDPGLYWKSELSATAGTEVAIETGYANTYWSWVCI